MLEIVFVQYIASTVHKSVSIKEIFYRMLDRIFIELITRCVVYLKPLKVLLNWQI